MILLHIWALVQDAIFVNALRIILEFLRYNIGNKTRDSLKRSNS